MPDTAVNVKFLEQELLTVNGALGVIKKKGQRIVDRGEIVTPQIFTNLNTYLDMLDTNSNTEHESTYFMVGQALYLLICFTGLFVFLSIYRPIFYESDKKIAFLVTFITLFVIFSVLMFEYFANGPYFVPYAMVPVVILVFFDSRTAIFLAGGDSDDLRPRVGLPFPVHIPRTGCGTYRRIQHQHPGVSARSFCAQHFSHFWPTARPTPPSGSSPTATSPISNGVPSEPLPSTQWCSRSPISSRARSRKNLRLHLHGDSRGAVRYQ